MNMCHLGVDKFRVKRQQWIECLDGDDSNSITNQLTRITWDITAFRVLMETVLPLALDAEDGGKQLNGLLFRLLQQSFADSLLMGLRRLMGNEGLHGSSGVYSLSSLLKDIAEHAHLLTRDAIIRLGPPDSVMLESQHGEEFLQDWAYSKNRLIDELVGASEGQRIADDQIPRELFDNLHKNLEERYAKARHLVNKEIAHAATPQSRIGFEYRGILWCDLYELHAELCKAAHFLLNLICDSGLYSFLPTPLGDQFDYLSRPIVTDADIPKLHQRWAELEAEYASWGNYRPAK